MIPAGGGVKNSDVSENGNLSSPQNIAQIAETYKHVLGSTSSSGPSRMKASGNSDAILNQLAQDIEELGKKQAWGLGNTSGNNSSFKYMDGKTWNSSDGWGRVVMDDQVFTKEWEYSRDSNEAKYHKFRTEWI